MYVLPGTLLLEAADRAGLLLETPCGGQGTCGKCRLRIVSGRVDSSPTPVLSDSEISEGWCLACLTRVTEDTIAEVPGESLLDSSHQILVDGASEKIQSHSAMQ